MVPILITLVCTLSAAVSAADADYRFEGIAPHANATASAENRRPQLSPVMTASAPKETAEPRKRDEDEAGAEASQDQSNVASSL